MNDCERTKLRVLASMLDFVKERVADAAERENMCFGGWHLEERMPLLQLREAVLTIEKATEAIDRACAIKLRERVR